jgi:hypothetical protein
MEVERVFRSLVQDAVTDLRRNTKPEKWEPGLRYPRHKLLPGAGHSRLDGWDFKKLKVKWYSAERLMNKRCAPKKAKLQGSTGRSGQKNAEQPYPTPIH